MAKQHLICTVCYHYMRRLAPDPSHPDGMHEKCRKAGLGIAGRWTVHLGHLVQIPRDFTLGFDYRARDGRRRRYIFFYTKYGRASRFVDRLFGTKAQAEAARNRGDA